ncbi:MAG: hypothetical protein KatS3mg102_2225 [Planctomycetota bacterium]|nr:MAG: hypothetical protein KatS3mg102_2225 [Planctomycetota bacterium]
MKRGSWYALGTVAVLAVLTASSSLYVVNEWEQVVVTEFGRPVGEPVLAAGLHLKKPFIQKVHRFDKRLLRWDGRAHETFSKDRKTIEIDVTARWRISDPLKFLQSVRTIGEAHRRLDGIIESAVKNTLAKYDLYEIVRSTNRLPRAAADAAAGADAADAGAGARGAGLRPGRRGRGHRRPAAVGGPGAR